jgi:hypothetical protein
MTRHHLFILVPFIALACNTELESESTGAVAAPVQDTKRDHDCDDKCDPNLICGDALTCVDGALYPSTCGPDNCDEPIGRCDEKCDPNLICAEVITCWDDGLKYPTACGPDNCDEPIGRCDEKCDAT